MLGTNVTNAGTGGKIKHPDPIGETGGIDPALDRQISANHRSGRNLVPAFRERQSPLPDPQGRGTGDGLAHSERLSDPGDSVVLNILHAAILGEVVVVAADIVGGRLTCGTNRVGRS